MPSAPSFTNVHCTIVYTSGIYNCIGAVGAALLLSARKVVRAWDYAHATRKNPCVDASGAAVCCFGGCLPLYPRTAAAYPPPCSPLAYPAATTSCPQYPPCLRRTSAHSPPTHAAANSALSSHCRRAPFNPARHLPTLLRPLRVRNIHPACGGHPPCAHPPARRLLLPTSPKGQKSRRMADG